MGHLNLILPAIHVLGKGNLCRIVFCVARVDGGDEMLAVAGLVTCDVVQGDVHGIAVESGTLVVQVDVVVQFSAVSHQLPVYL